MTIQTQEVPSRGQAPRRVEDEWLGIGRSVLYGLQHILSMFGGLIAVPIIVAGAAGLNQQDKTYLLACTLFICGLATVLQAVGAGRFLGSRLPLVQGVTFAAVTTMTAIIGASGGGTQGLRTAYGAILAASALAFLIVPLFAKLVHFFPPVVTGSVITIIGLSLIPAAGKWITGQPVINGQPNPNFADWRAVVLAMVTLASVLVFTRIRATSRFAILLGLATGTIIALAVGFQKFQISGAIAAFPLPFHFGLPLFSVSAIISMFIVMLVVMVETTADILAVGEVVGSRVDSKRVAAGLRADTLSSMIAPIFNTFPATAFAQNVGLVAMTGVKSRWVVAVGGGILAIIGLSPALASIVNVIPLPVLGGVGICLFGSVAASGVRTLAKVKYDGTHNATIVAVSLGFGLLPYMVPGFWGGLPHWLALIMESGISATALVSILLNVFFNMVGSQGGVDDATSPANAPVPPVVAGRDRNAAPTERERYVAALDEDVEGFDQPPDSK